MEDTKVNERELNEVDADNSHDMQIDAEIKGQADVETISMSANNTVETGAKRFDETPLSHMRDCTTDSPNLQEKMSASQFHLVFKNQHGDIDGVAMAMNFFEKWFDDARGEIYIWANSENENGLKFAHSQKKELREYLQKYIALPADSAEYKQGIISFNPCDKTARETFCRGFIVFLPIVNDVKVNGKIVDIKYRNSAGLPICPDIETARVAIESFARRFNIRPAFIVDTKSGLQIYWAFIGSKTSFSWVYKHIDFETEVESEGDSFAKFFRGKILYAAESISPVNAKNYLVVPGSYRRNINNNLIQSRVIYEGSNYYSYIDIARVIVEDRKSAEQQKNLKSDADNSHNETTGKISPVTKINSAQDDFSAKENISDCDADISADEGQRDLITPQENISAENLQPKDLTKSPNHGVMNDLTGESESSTETKVDVDVTASPAQIEDSAGNENSPAINPMSAMEGNANVDDTQSHPLADPTNDLPAQDSDSNSEKDSAQDTEKVQSEKSPTENLIAKIQSAIRAAIDAGLTEVDNRFYVSILKDLQNSVEKDSGLTVSNTSWVLQGGNQFNCNIADLVKNTGAGGEYKSRIDKTSEDEHEEFTFADIANALKFVEGIEGWIEYNKKVEEIKEDDKAALDDLNSSADVIHHDQPTSADECETRAACERKKIPFIRNANIKIINKLIRRSITDAEKKLDEVFTYNDLTLEKLESTDEGICSAAVICCECSPKKFKSFESLIRSRLREKVSRTTIIDYFRYIKAESANVKAALERFRDIAAQNGSIKNLINFENMYRLQMPEQYEIGTYNSLLEIGDIDPLSFTLPFISKLYKRTKSNTLCADVTILSDDYKETIIPQVDLKKLVTTKELLALANYGLSVTQKRAEALAQYFDRFRWHNRQRLRPVKLYEQVGWQSDDEGKEIFVTPANNKLHIDQHSASFITSTVKTGGTLEEWKALAAEVATKLIPRFVLAASFAPPLLKLLNVRTFSVYLYASSLAGKSAACRFAASAWGSADFVRNLDTTINGLEVELSENNDFPFFSDEKQLAKLTMSDLIYKLAQGQQRGRSTSDITVRQRKEWRTIGIFSGEELITDDIKTQGAITRCLQIEIRDIKILPDELSARIYREIKQNYGWAAKVYLDSLTKESNSQLTDIFTKLADVAKKSAFEDLVEAHITYIALIGVADYLMQKNVFGKAHDEALKNTIAMTEKIARYIESKTNLSDAYREKALVEGWLVSNYQAIENHPNLPRITNKEGDMVIQTDVVDARALAKQTIGFYSAYDADGNADNCLYIYEKAMKDMLARYNLNYSAVCNNLVRIGYFIMGKNNKPIQKYHNGGKPRCIKIPFAKDSDSFE